MTPHQRSFLDFILTAGILRFGEFTLKSGRVSPYFFNAGLFYTGEAITRLGEVYSATIQQHGLQADVLYGPAYKGIPLAVTTSAALFQHYQRDIPYCFNRKEAKTHGEGGSLVGAPMNGKKILIIDDVITAGTAIRESLEVLKTVNATPTGVVIALDRQERGTGALSAIEEVQQHLGLPVYSILKLEHIITHIRETMRDSALLDKVEAYRATYGV